MLLSLSGGGTKIAALLGIVETLYKKNHISPTVITGVSSGALLSLPMVLGLWDNLKDGLLSGNLSTIFTNPPFKKNGNIKLLSYLKLLFFGNFGKQNIQSFLSKIVSEQDYVHYKSNPLLYPPIFIATTNADTQESVIWNLQDTEATYKKYLDIVAASCAVPFVTPPIKINGQSHFDGGLRYHNLASKMLENGLQCDKVVSIYARPAISEKKALYKHSFSKVVPFTINTLLCSISENNEAYEKYYCETKNIDLEQIFVEMETNGFYISDKNILNSLYQYGANLAENL